ncbi:unconventional myosin-XIX-like isoform X2 [Biomphalaria glabrata]|uniref:Unconventional myosin-XIX-like isoform X2 n=1 Tax=Biomphalaria glabrata TaxID=6526 RepID=A0A9W2YJN4_BIOGL|nr:unconventional myosin-XIX-like isoform X2 [Biomphalaria glabrata]
MSFNKISQRGGGDGYLSHAQLLGKRKEMKPKAWSNEATRKLTQGQSVYVKDAVEAWIPAVVVEEADSRLTVTVQLADDSIVMRKSSEVLARSEETELFICSSLTELNPVNEASALDCLHQRFSQDIFYTAAGTTIVAVNPFKDVHHLYNQHKIQDYHRPLQTLDPHIFMIGEKAYAHMLREMGNINQSIVVSGESGAGKTVSAKHLLKYLTIVSSPENEINLECSIPASVIERRVLDSNPILESFGNAATPRNENSSRFGKFIQLQFHRNGYILGGVIQTYLLEKTRVVHQGPGENNFHIFYQLMSLGDIDQVPSWLVAVRAEVQHSGLDCTVPQQAETLSVLQTVEAMSDIGVSTSQQVSIFKILLAILHLSTMKFISIKDGEACTFSDTEDTDQFVYVSSRTKEECCRLLGISALSLHHALLNRKIVTGTKAHQSVYVKPVTVAEAQSRRDSLAMLLYSRIFDWLVNFINTQIKADTFDHCINLLDIYGFETFEINNLEQLCINYANERLQQHYVTHFLRDLQTEYELEQITWTPIEYKDNKTCVETLHGPSGVFGILNEEVTLNRASDDSILCGRIITGCGAKGVVRKHGAGTFETKFIVRHYAGDVVYSVEKAVKKNKDNIPPELIALVATSEDSFLQDLFTNDEFSYTEQSLTPTKTKKKITVLTKFKSSLDRLMQSLERSDVHFIRCIKPNTNNRPGVFDRTYVLQQLEACGTLETVNICRLGYPARMDYKDFIQRYGFLARLSNAYVVKKFTTEASINNNCVGTEAEQDEFFQKVESQMSHFDLPFLNSGHKRLKKISVPSTDQSYRQCATVLVCIFPLEELHNAHAQFGKHKIFLTQTQMDHLEHTRASIIALLIARVQASWRAFSLQRSFCRYKVAALKIQAAWRRHSAQVHFCEVKLGSIKIQRAWRGYKLRCAVKTLVKLSHVLKRSLIYWTRRHRFKTALQKLHIQKLKEISSQAALSQELNTSELTVLPDLNLKESHEKARTSKKLKDQIDHNMVEDFSDTGSVCSDDSGVMIRDDLQSLAGDPAIESPPMKKHFTLRRDLRIGNGIITCRCLTKPGFRFHARRSVLKYGHFVGYPDVTLGLLDILQDDLE